MSDGHRPIERADYERAYAVMHALEMALEEPREAPWEHLVFLHEQRVSDTARVPTEVLAGDSGFSAERNRALILLERLMHGHDTVPVTVSATSRRCSTPRFPETTSGLYCPPCELKRGPSPDA